MEPDSGTDDPQERWARLCRYLSKSVLAEMADTLVRLQATDKWFLHDTESEGLVTGALDCAAIPERLAAPLPCNGSQELTLERFRSKPLTVVTGPPGTGKTQLVVNAVANAWLDGEKVLVASTNNGAVDVAAERANEICSGMLLRTGRSQDREELAHRAAQAVAAASDGEVSSDGFKSVKNEARNRAELAHAAERRARLSADLAAAAARNRKLSGVVEDLERHARAIWNRARAPGLDVVPEVAASR